MSQGGLGPRAQQQNAGRERGRREEEEERKERMEGRKKEKEVPGGDCFAYNSHKETHDVGKKFYIILYIDILTTYSHCHRVVYIVKLSFSI